jgi:hypothetical protein
MLGTQECLERRRRTANRLDHLLEKIAARPLSLYIGGSRKYGQDDDLMLFQLATRHYFTVDL